MRQRRDWCSRLALLLAWMTVCGSGHHCQEYIHSSESKEVAQSTLRGSGSTWSGEVTSEGTRVVASIELDAEGFVASYRRELRSRSPDRLIERVTLTSKERGYALREEQPLGSRTRDVGTTRVRGVVDASWPEILIPTVFQRSESAFLLLVLATADIQTVALRAREDRSRYLDLQGGGVTADAGEAGIIQRMRLPGAGKLIITRKDAASALAAATSLSSELISERIEIPGAEGDPAIPAAVVRNSKVTVPSVGIILLADAGVRDLDGDRPGSREGLLLELAERLAAAGMVVLRYEKRDGRDPTAGLAALRADLVAASKWLRTRPDVIPDGVVLIGHGEGGIVGLDALSSETPVAKGLILLGSPVQPLAETLDVRLEATMRLDGKTEDEIRTAQAELKTDLAELEALPPDADPGPGRRILKDLLALDPMRSLGRVQRMSVLFIHGSRDLEVPSDHVVLLRTALALRQNPSHRSHTLEGADHGFRSAEGLRAQDILRSQGADSGRPLHADLIPLLVAFAKEAAGAPAK